MDAILKWSNHTFDHWNGWTKLFGKKKKKERDVGLKKKVGEFGRIKII
jgi:hypothetical protein